MTDQVTGSAALQGKEIERLAREIAEQDTRCEIPEVHEAAVKLNAELIKRILHKVLRTHCIVEKEKVIKEFNYYKTSWNETELVETTMDSFKSLFGADLFKNDTDNG